MPLMLTSFYKSADLVFPDDYGYVTSSIYRTRSYMKWQYGRVHHGAIGGNSQDMAFGVLVFH